MTTSFHFLSLPSFCFSSFVSLCSRIRDINDNSEENYRPVRGIPQTPSLPLIECIKNDVIITIIPDVSIIPSLLIKAESRLKNNPLLQLTVDELASIYLFLYSIPLYTTINRLLQDEDPDKLIPFLSYLKLLFFGLAKLPRQSNIRLYQGIKKNIHDNFFEKEEVINWRISSCINNKKLLLSDDVLGENGDRTILSINAKYAIDISVLFSPSELLLDIKEYFLFGGACLEVIAIREEEGGLTVIEMEECDEPLQLGEIIEYLNKNNNNNELIEEYRMGGIMEGEEFRRFSSPNQLFIDHQTNQLLIADCGNYRIQVLANGDRRVKYLFNIGTGNTEDNNKNKNKNKEGLRYPIGVWGFGGEVFVSDTWNHRIMVYNAANGELLRKWGKEGQGKKALNYPRHLCIDGDKKELYVVSKNIKCIQIYSLFGIHHRSIRLDNFKNPWGLALWGRYCYVTDAGAGTFSVFDKINGQLKKKIIIGQAVWGVCVANDVIYIAAKKEILLYNVIPPFTFIRSFVVPNLSRNEKIRGVFVYRFESVSALYLSIYPSSVRIFQLE